MPDVCCCSGVAFSAQTFCKAWQNAQSCSGELCPKFPTLGFQTPQCPWMCSHSCVSIRDMGLSCGVRAQREFPCPGLSPHHFTPAHGTDPLELGTWKEGGAWWGSERRKGKCHPGSFSATGTVSGSVGRGSNRFPYGRVWPQELFLINLKIHPVKHPQLGISKLTFPMSTKFPSPRTRVCHRLSDGFTSWRHFHSGPWIHCLFFYDEAKVNVNNEFLGMLGTISRVKTAVFKDKDWSLIGSLESVSQLQPEQELPHGKTPGLGRNILEYTETFEETPARDTSSQPAAGPCHDSAFSHSPHLFPSTENVIKTWKWLIPSREWFSMLASW